MPVPPDGIDLLENSVIDGATPVVMSSNQEAPGVPVVIDGLRRAVRWQTVGSTLGPSVSDLLIAVLGPRLSEQPWSLARRCLAARATAEATLSASVYRQDPLVYATPSPRQYLDVLAPFVNRR
jgi:hypothetical protein